MLEIRALTKRFLGVPALEDVSFTVEKGDMVGLIGPNGSGKTTLFDCVTGFLCPDAGSVMFRGRDITRLSPHLVSRMGLSRSFQQVRVFPRLTALENLRAAGQQHQGVHLCVGLLPTRRSRRLDGELDERALELLTAMGISSVADAPAGTLSYGQQKLLEICMALMSRPAMLLLDEPVAGVNPTLIQHIKEYIRRLNAAGVTFLIIEHNLEVVMDLCHRVIVLDSGELIAHGPPEMVQADERVLSAYFGR
ncbi:MAG: ABC transporter ATP-binding protein [Thermodesulfobacteriota bacterium]